VADEPDNREAFRIQQRYCAAMDAPITARICAALATCLTRDSETGARALDWPGEPTRDALPLRLVGGLHALARQGDVPALSPIFAGEVHDEAHLAAVLSQTLVTHDAALLPWLDGPPQTNEPGRSGALMTGLLEVARRHGPQLELLEIGASAGLNLLIDRYHFDLGGVQVGPAGAPVTIRPEWRGPPPPDVPLTIVGVRGCDVAPIDVTDSAAAERLAAYVWADQPQRQQRLARAIAMIRERPVRLERADAADWIEARLAEPQQAGVTRVLLHSVVWQYLPEKSQARIDAAAQAAGAAATRDRPFAWVAMEPDRVLNRQEIRVRSWPGGGAATQVATAHAHGLWIAGAAR